MKRCNNERKPSTNFSNDSVTITWSLTVINTIYLKAPLMSFVLNENKTIKNSSRKTQDKTIGNKVNFEPRVATLRKKTAQKYGWPSLSS